MNINERITYLETRHKELDVLVNKEVKGRSNQTLVEQHKKEKLLLKDEIQALRKQLVA